MKYQLQLAKDSKSLVVGPHWIAERKWDGMRAVFELSPTGTLIFSRTGQDLRLQFPELLDLHLRVGTECVLDGEIVALSEPDHESLELLQMRSGDKKARRQAEIPVEVRFFDILSSQGCDTRDCCLAERLSLLENVLARTEFEMPEIFSGSSTSEIPSHWEGVVMKELSSRYESGKRRRSWSKFKFVQRATLIATGLTPGLGARESSFGAITVSDANGVHRGQVGSGFTPEALVQVQDAIDSGVMVLVEVEYRFLSKTGLMVNTAFKGLRVDKVEADSL